MNNENEKTEVTVEAETAAEAAEIAAETVNAAEADEAAETAETDKTDKKTGFFSRLKVQAKEAAAGAFKKVIALLPRRRTIVIIENVGDGLFRCEVQKFVVRVSIRGLKEAAEADLNAMAFKKMALTALIDKAATVGGAKTEFVKKSDFQFDLVVDGEVKFSAVLV